MNDTRKPRARITLRSDMNWKRFWIQMALAMLAFNILAGLVTWFLIFPRLFPGR